MKIAYYAILNYDEYDKAEQTYGISITFPDVPAAISCARNEKEAVEMALEALQLTLIRKDGTWPSEGELPTATQWENIALQKNETAVMIQFDTEQVDLSQFQFFDEPEQEEGIFSGNGGNTNGVHS